MASFTRMRHHSLDLSDEVFELDNPLLRLVSSLIHDFFRISPNRKRTRGGKLPPSFLLLCFSSSTRSSRVFRSERNIRIALVCERGKASTSLNVRFYYDVTMNYCRDKFVRFAKNTSINNVYIRSLMTLLLSESLWIMCRINFFSVKILCKVYHANIGCYQLCISKFDELNLFKAINVFVSLWNYRALLWQEFNLDINCYDI